MKYTPLLLTLLILLTLGCSQSPTTPPPPPLTFNEVVTSRILEHIDHGEVVSWNHLKEWPNKTHASWRDVGGTVYWEKHPGRVMYYTATFKPSGDKLDWELVGPPVVWWEDRL